MMKGIIGFLIVAAIVVFVLPNVFHQTGDIFYYDFHGVVTDYYYPPGWKGTTDWAYYDNDLGAGSFISVCVDDQWHGGFTCCKENLAEYLGESVTVYCSGCCYDDCIDDIVRDSDWWIFWK